MRAQFIGTACGLALALGAVSVPAAEAATVATCNGVRATIVSSAATVTGTAARDVIVGTRTSGQTINALGGNDLICTSSGPDVINAGDGTDMVLAGGGNDRVDGGAGADMLNGGAGTDTLVGGLGNDSLNGGAARDALTAGAGLNVCSTDPLDTVVGACPPDTSRPVISAVSVPTSVAAGGVLSLQFDVADAGGVNNAFFKISGASGWVTTWCGFGTDAPLVAGTPFAGTYSASCSIPAAAVNGTYTLWFDAQDSFGNFTNSTQVDFQVGGGSADAAAPVVSEVSAGAVPRSPGAVVVRWRATDETGVGGAAAYLALNGYSFADNTGASYFDYGSAVTRVSGDAKDGTYEVTLLRRSNAPAGIYTLWISIVDTLGNKDFQMQPPNSPVTVTLP